MARLRANQNEESSSLLGEYGNNASPEASVGAYPTGMFGNVQPGGSPWEGGLTPAGGGGPTFDAGSQSGETPRERGVNQMASGMGAGNVPGAPDVRLRSGSGGAAAQATPSRPSSPTPMAGSTFTPASGGNAPSAAGAGTPSGVVPFEPMSTPNIGSLASAGGSNGLFGGAGGLTGGGLGVPLDPTSNLRSNPLEMLVQLLQRRG